MNETKQARASTPRSRTGCATCRTRKLKCDEARPQCRRCKHSGWQCPGYTQPGLPQHTENAATEPHELLSVPGKDALAHLHISQYALPFKVPGSRDERQALHYFSTFAASDISDLSSYNFWSYTILQRCTHDAPLRHAAAALGQLHVEYIATPKTQDFTPSPDAIKAYGRGIKSLRIYLDNNERPSRSMVLMCSAVFFCFDLVRGEQDAASRHLESGLQMLKYWQNNDSTASDVDANEMGQLLAVFAHMDLEATVFDQDRVPVLQIRAEDTVGSSHCKDTSQTTLHDLHRSVFALSHAGIAFLVESVPHKTVDMCNIPEPIAHQRRQLVKSVESWMRRADNVTQKALSQPKDSDLHHKYRTTIAMGKLHCGMMRLLLLHSLDDEIKAAAPSFDDEAAHLLDAAEIALSPRDQDTVSTKRRFSLHLGTVQPIFLLALKVQDASLRERALIILNCVQGRREGFHDAFAMAETVNMLASKAMGSVSETESTALEYIVERIGYQ